MRPFFIRVDPVGAEGRFCPAAGKCIPMIAALPVPFMD